MKMSPLRRQRAQPNRSAAVSSSTSRACESTRSTKLIRVAVCCEAAAAGLRHSSAPAQGLLFQESFNGLPIMSPPALVFPGVIPGRQAHLREPKLRPAAGAFGKLERDDGIVPGRPAARAPRLHDAPGGREFQRDAVEVTVVASECPADFAANPRARAGELRVLLLVHQ